ncbi:hypothetical protein G9A89_002957, partial [Geosiphon pyriformis]
MPHLPCGSRVKGGTGRRGPWTRALPSSPLQHLCTLPPPGGGWGGGIVPPRPGGGVLGLGHSPTAPILAPPVWDGGGVLAGGASPPSPRPPGGGAEPPSESGGRSPPLQAYGLPPSPCPPVPSSYVGFEEAGGGDLPTPSLAGGSARSARTAYWGWRVGSSTPPRLRRVEALVTPPPTARLGGDLPTPWCSTPP